MGKKKAKKKTSKAPATAEDYMEDDGVYTTASEKNESLAGALTNGWCDLHIVKIKRIEISGKPGWRVFYRK